MIAKAFFPPYIGMLYVDDVDRPETRSHAVGLEKEGGRSEPDLPPDFMADEEQKSVTSPKAVSRISRGWGTASAKS